jgi:ABC-type dipeptide/oligopeptide/nickel transport system ATPase component
MKHVRGKEVAMIFQEPMRSINPVMLIGKQITEALLSA